MKLTEKYKLIIFDCDGTLVDSEKLSNAVVSEMIREHGISISDHECLQLFKGTHFQKILDYVENNSGKPANGFESEFRKRCALAFRKNLKEVEGATDFINALKIDYCVASNGPHIKMRTSLSVTGLSSLIPENRIFSAYDIGSFKPEPDLFLYAAAKCGHRKEQSLVIEDTIPGIQAALSAEMDVWAMHHPGLNDEILEYDIPRIQSFRNIRF